MKAIQPGIEALSSLLKQPNYRKKTYAVLCHPPSINSKFQHLVELMELSKVRLRALFGPQHGIYGETQDNMIEWEDFKDEQNRPVYSLYGKTRIPTEASLDGIDSIVVDLFDVGARYYTFIYTLSYMMEVAGKLGKEVIICDRPNPLGGKMIEGPILQKDFRSFVGRFEIPTVHGMSIGELAQLFADRMDSPPPLKILRVKNWSRKDNFEVWGKHWMLPSPNLPTFEGCRFYPGMCLLEATNLSEGRGTTRPFELIGAPFMNWKEIEKLYRPLAKKFKLPEVVFHRQGFAPNFHKHQGQLCHGATQVLLSKKDFPALRHAVILLWVFRKLYGDQWKWTSPPYEYEYKNLPIDILAGSTRIRECIDQQSSLSDLFKDWEKDEKSFQKIRKKYLLY
jgi:uncharacterized protein YbbC (DUF1343 family)